MSRTAILLALALSSVLPTLAHAQNHLMTDHSTASYDCGKDAVTNIMGNHNKVTLVGTCDAITISDNGNQVIGDHAKALTISGDDNALAVTVTETVTVSGNRNALTWTAAKDVAPKLSISGKDNKVAAAPASPPKPTR